jgi:23S rRNA pseudouridine2457 synthase
MLIAFNKPYGVLCQFTSDGTAKSTLADFHFPKHVYPLGRLDTDSEGLLLLSNEGGLNEKLLHPDKKHERTYWAQVDGIPSDQALEKLRKGVVIQDRKTLPCRAMILDPQPQIPQRDPPIRFRKNIPTTWIELILHEGKNRQVRRMTAVIGHPTLRLLRVRIGQFLLGNLEVGKWREVNADEQGLIFQ